MAFLPEEFFLFSLGTILQNARRLQVEKNNKYPELCFLFREIDLRGYPFFKVWR